LLNFLQEKGKKKQQKSAAGSVCLAAGTAAGDVKLFDVHVGELKWRAVDVVQG
jgi:U3 small nucleolar RNA-associated protein 5